MNDPERDIDAMWRERHAYLALELRIIKERLCALWTYYHMQNIHETCSCKDFCIFFEDEMRTMLGLSAPLISKKGNIPD